MGNKKEKVDEDKRASSIPLNPLPSTSNPKDTDAIRVDIDIEGVTLPKNPVGKFKLYYNLYYEMRVRMGLYVVYFLLFICLTSSCHYSLEGFFTLSGIIILILLRTIIVDKCLVSSSSSGGGGGGGKTSSSWGNKCKRCCSFTCCFFMTMIALFGFTLTNFANKRILDDGDEHLCAYPVTTPLLHSNSSSSNLALKVNSTQSSSGEGQPCLVPCGIIYFYPMALLLLDLFCYTGLTRVMTTFVFLRILNPCWVKIVKIMTTPLVSAIVIGTLIGTWILLTMASIGIWGYVLILLRFEYNNLAICIVICALLLIWSVGLLVPLYHKFVPDTEQGTNFISTIIIGISSFLAGACIMTGVVAVFISEHDQHHIRNDNTEEGSSFHVKYIPVEKVGEHVLDLKFGNDALFWLYLGLVSLLQVTCFAIANAIGKTGIELKHWVGAFFGCFIVPFIPLIVVLGVMAFIYLFFMKCLMTMECGSVGQPSGGGGGSGSGSGSRPKGDNYAGLVLGKGGWDFPGRAVPLGS